MKISEHTLQKVEWIFWLTFCNWFHSQSLCEIWATMWFQVYKNYNDGYNYELFWAKFAFAKICQAEDKNYERILIVKLNISQKKKNIICCYNLEKSFPPLLEVPDLIKNLLYNHSLSAKNYRQFICEYNTRSFFASMEAQFKVLIASA